MEKDYSSYQEPVLTQEDLSALYSRPIPTELRKVKKCTHNYHAFIAKVPIFHPKNSVKFVKATLVTSGAGEGAMFGMALGTFFPAPLVGSAVGAGVGGIVGGGVAYIGATWGLSRAQQQADDLKPPMSEDERQNILARMVYDSIVEIIKTDEMVLNYACPISEEIFTDPVFTPSGKVYQRTWIEEEMRRQFKSAAAPHWDTFIFNDLGVPFSHRDLLECNFFSVALQGRIQHILLRDSGLAENKEIAPILRRAASLAEVVKDQYMVTCSRQKELLIRRRGDAQDQGLQHWFDARMEHKWVAVENALSNSDFSGIVPIALTGDHSL